ncbi:DUF2243 domain-containing protein [Deinococcus sp. SDU3-2]|uniref:DUF2243 domain-containing protein n=1 Tax=Deinococcus terrestris TaxID=2651870 RepID=A0A7X1NWR0_9DEIO|nr:DUF2243 domain-containing protein [Deinococcus terrestris]MPY66874.1 DUF2243 domain-containing protein [Deinococcus terrestris]
MTVTEGPPLRTNTNPRSWLWGGVFLGLGLGGFFDGIVLHQILQWHHLLSEVYLPTTLENLKINTVADGFFHAATWVFTLIGIFLLWQGTRGQHVTWSTRALVGALLLGWGLFNVVEGLVDHQILQIHHVRPGPNQALYDVGFLVWGAAMLLIGWALMRQPRAGSVRA